MNYRLYEIVKPVMIEKGDRIYPPAFLEGRETQPPVSNRRPAVKKTATGYEHIVREDLSPEVRERIFITQSYLRGLDSEPIFQVGGPFASEKKKEILREVLGLRERLRQLGVLKLDVNIDDFEKFVRTFK